MLSLGRKLERDVDMRLIFGKLPANGLVLVACFALLIFITKHYNTLTTAKDQSIGNPSTATAEEIDTNSQPEQSKPPQYNPDAGTTNSSEVVTKPVSGQQTPYKQLIMRKGLGGTKRVALTFDDGPDNKYTKQVMDILKQNQVKATFFVLGQEVKKYPEVVKQMVYEGHAIGNHSWSHINMARVTPQQLRDQLDATNQAVKQAAGVSPYLVRPPFGNTNGAVTQQLTNWGYQVVLWSVDSRDWSGIPTEKIMSKVRQEMSPGGIILQHSAGGRKNDLTNTIQALPLIIKELKAQGYTFVTVPEMLAADRAGR